MKTEVGQAHDLLSAHRKTNGTGKRPDRFATTNSRHAEHEHLLSENEVILRRHRYRRRARGMRSGGSRSHHGCQDLPHNDGYEQDGADELQPRRGRNSQGTDSARDRRTGRTHGHRHRRDGNTVPHAQPRQRPRSVESACTMRPRQVHLGMAQGNRRHARTRRVAGRSLRTARGAGRSRGRDNGMGRGIPRQGNDNHRRDIPQRAHACGQKAGAGRALRRTRRAAFHRKHNATRHNGGKNEDGNSSENRPPERTLRRNGGAAGRTDIPQIQLYGHRPTAEAAALLDLQHQRRSARDTARSHRRLPTLQRTDTIHRTALLPFHRDQARDIPRQAAAPALPRT